MGLDLQIESPIDSGSIASSDRVMIITGGNTAVDVTTINNLATYINNFGTSLIIVNSVSDIPDSPTAGDSMYFNVGISPTNVYAQFDAGGTPVTFSFDGNHQPNNASFGEISRVLFNVRVDEITTPAMIADIDGTLGTFSDIFDDNDNANGTDPGVVIGFNSDGTVEYRFGAGAGNSADPVGDPGDAAIWMEGDQTGASDEPIYFFDADASHNLTFNINTYYIYNGSAWVVSNGVDNLIEALASKDNITDVNNKIRNITVEALENVVEVTTPIGTADYTSSEDGAAAVFNSGAVQVVLEGDVRSSAPSPGDKIHPIINGNASASFYCIVNEVQTTLTAGDTVVECSGASQALINYSINNGFRISTAEYLIGNDLITGWHDDTNLTFEGPLLVRNATTGNWETIDDLPAGTTIGGEEIGTGSTDLTEVHNRLHSLEANQIPHTTTHGTVASSTSSATTANQDFEGPSTVLYDARLEVGGGLDRFQCSVANANNRWVEGDSIAVRFDSTTFLGVVHRNDRLDANDRLLEINFATDDHTAIRETASATETVGSVVAHYWLASEVTLFTTTTEAETEFTGPTVYDELAEFEGGADFASGTTVDATGATLTGFYTGGDGIDIPANREVSVDETVVRTTDDGGWTVFVVANGGIPATPADGTIYFEREA